MPHAYEDQCRRWRTMKMIAFRRFNYLMGRTDLNLGMAYPIRPMTNTAMDNTCPLLSHPNLPCHTGWVWIVNSMMNLIIPYPIKKKQLRSPDFRGLYLMNHRNPNMTSPSKSASYNCDGCRGYGPAEEKTIPHGKSVTRP